MSQAMKRQMHWLAELGYRPDTPTLEQSQGEERRASYAACGSTQCIKGSSKLHVRKDSVTDWGSNCPDCGHALIWKLESVSVSRKKTP